MSQVKLIDDYIKTSEINLIINNYDEEIIIFYLQLIRYFAEENKTKIIFEENQDLSLDLFGNRNINIYRTTSSKNIEKLFNDLTKKIIITDYKNFKKYNKTVCSINTYQYEQDVKTYITKKLKITNNDLISFCQNNPVLAFSEISKYLTNENNYINDESLNIETNHILNIRKSIFISKKEKRSFQDLYNLIKREADYKKFNFLTY